MKNLECRINEAAMGYDCDKQVADAMADIYDRQGAEWFDFSNSTRIDCRVAAGTTALSPYSPFPGTQFALVCKVHLGRHGHSLSTHVVIRIQVAAAACSSRL